ncbi:hypothetical protein CBM2587_A110031 [Cupriavidus taiwanensis]|uniref:Uncharacterized protein n=1 Tax=Cupriavidus taiwanensis TaxID=164546 RepID=A0A375BFT2_9BURK|nr:hypothetical protein CBM2587_A110031 [Cupriavidus taiwanensis]
MQQALREPRLQQIYARKLRLALRRTNTPPKKGDIELLSKSPTPRNGHGTHPLPATI